MMAISTKFTMAFALFSTGVLASGLATSTTMLRYGVVHQDHNPRLLAKKASKKGSKDLLSKASKKSKRSKTGAPSFALSDNPSSFPTLYSTFAASQVPTTSD